MHGASTARVNAARWQHDASLARRAEGSWPGGYRWRLEPLTSEILTGSAEAQPVSDTAARPLSDTAAQPPETAERTAASPAHAAHAVPFGDLGVSEKICAALAAANIHTTFPIQALTLPIALGGHDIIGQARTGTGKTLGFGIPLLQRLEAGSPASPGAPLALVVVPTRELAIQVADDLRMAGSGVGARILTLYGGRAYEPQIEALRAGIDVVVSTPGRLLDLVGQRHLTLSEVRTLVLDEADKMLDLGFLPDVERILQLTSGDRQTMMFSATMPGEVVTLARKHLRQPTHVRAETIDAPAPVPTTRQHVFRTHHLDKVEMLARVLQAEGRGLTMVFCQTKRGADQLAGALTTRGFAVATVHGDLGQGQRERALRAFRSGKVDVLVATEVAARGIDVEDVTHVVNFECPDDEKTYLHRIGRTGRAGKEGVAVTFVDWRDMHRWKLIDEALSLGQAEPAETYSTSEHLFTELGIPRTATGTLPRAQRDRAGLEAEVLEDLGETGRSTPRHRDRGRDKRRAAGTAPHGRGSGGRGADGQDGHDSAAPRERTRVRRRTRGGREAVGAQPGSPAGPAAPAPAAGPSPAGTVSASTGSPGEGQHGQGETAAPSAAPAGSASSERGPRVRRRRTRRGGQQAS
jgi:superfamily II DNA/RNA helicase